MPCANAKCLSCNSSACTACQGANRTGGACDCLAIGYYDAFVVNNPATYDCVPCTDPRCEVCSSTSPSYCDTCYGTNRDPNCSCPVGTADIFAAGVVSTYDCVTCSNGKCAQCPTSPTTCIACVSVERVIPTCACPANFYFDAFVAGNPSTYACVSCVNQKCLACASTS